MKNINLLLSCPVCLYDLTNYHYIICAFFNMTKLPINLYMSENNSKFTP